MPPTQSRRYVTDHSDLRKAAQDATPGPWKAREGSDMYDHGKREWLVDFPGGDDASLLCETDATFIAAANPSRILALLDELDEAKRLLAEHAEKCKSYSKHSWCSGCAANAFLSRTKGPDR